MKNDQYAELRAAIDAYDADLGSSYARDFFYGNVDSDAVRALLAERDQYARVLDGLPQDAIDGGWTAAGMSAHAKTLEAENERLRETLETIANTKTRPGDEKAGLLLASAINLASVAVTQQEQS